VAAQRRAKADTWLLMERRFPCALCLQNLESYSFLIAPSYRGPETQRQADSHNRARGNSRSGFRRRRPDDRQHNYNAVFSYYKPNPGREMAKEQRHTNNNFICSRGKNLRPLNNRFVSARRVSIGSQITCGCQPGDYTTWSSELRIQV